VTAVGLGSSAVARRPLAKPTAADLRGTAIRHLRVADGAALDAWFANPDCKAANRTNRTHDFTATADYTEMRTNTDIAFDSSHGAFDAVPGSISRYSRTATP